jgi:hypothetical protein
MIIYKIKEINNILIDFPIKLKEGRIDKVEAKIPWTNILQEEISIEMENLELYFELKSNFFFLLKLKS